MNDRTTKTLLLLIALALWANAIVPLLGPKIAAAQDRTLSSIEDRLETIEHDLHNNIPTIEHDIHNLADIEDGTCRNKTICR
jgi:hypothetical protein